MLKKIFTSIFNLNFIFKLSALMTVVFTFLKSWNFNRMHSPIGDEANFLDVFKSFDSIGFYNTWASGNFSPSYHLLVYPINLVIGNALISMRVFALISTITTLFILYKIATTQLKLSTKYFNATAIFSISFMAYRIYWQGINDAFFYLLITLSVYLIYKIKFEKRNLKTFIFLGVILGLIFGTRQLSLMVIPCYIFFFYNDFKAILLVGITTLIIGVSLHLPAIITNNSLCKVDKTQHKTLTWEELNTASQDYIYQGKLKEGHRLTWEALEVYKLENPNIILPKSTIDTIKKHPKWIIRELFNDFYISIKQHYFKVFGLGVFIMLWFSVSGFKTEKGTILKFTHQLNLFFWLHTAFISFVVLTEIEIRWYTSFIYLGIISFHYILENENRLFFLRKNNLFLKVNYVLLMLFQLKFILTDSNLLSDYLRLLLR